MRHVNLLKLGFALVISSILSACQGAHDAGVDLEKNLVNIGIYLDDGNKISPAIWEENPSNFENVATVSDSGSLLFFGEQTRDRMGNEHKVFFFRRGYDDHSKPIEHTLESFFDMAPMEPVKGTSVLRLTPKPTVVNGSYALHKWTGFTEGAYVLFRVTRTR